MRNALAVALLAVAVCPAAAQDFELELSEQALNRLVARLGHPSARGVHQPDVLGSLGYTGCVVIGTLDCPAPATTVRAGQSEATGRPSVKLSSCRGPDGRLALVPAPEPVDWQWWITEARFTVAAQQLRFSATLRYRVGESWFTESRTVPATLGLDAPSQRLRLSVASFKVPIQRTSGGVTQTLTEVEVSRHVSFGIPVGTVAFQVPDLEGRTRTLTGRVQGAAVAYLPGKIQVKVDGALY